MEKKFVGFWVSQLVAWLLYLAGAYYLFQFMPPYIQWLYIVIVLVVFVFQILLAMYLTDINVPKLKRKK